MTFPRMRPYLALLIHHYCLRRVQRLPLPGIQRHDQQANRLRARRPVRRLWQHVAGRALAIVVILACCSGLGMGVADPTSDSGGTPDRTGRHGRASTKRISSRSWTSMANRVLKNGKPITRGGWKNHRLPQKVGAFVEGGANFLTAIGIPLKLGIAIIAVLVASFAATTLDTATRLQRYVIQELRHKFAVAPLRGKYVATAVAVITGGAIAMVPGPAGPGSGGLILWPLFGATNQLLAGLAFLVLLFYLARRKLPFWFAALPAVLMLLLPGWAMLAQILNDFWPNRSWLLFSFGTVILALQCWIALRSGANVAT